MVEEIFNIIREATSRSSTSIEPGGRISCYFEFSSLQSMVVSVWGWLSLGVFEYRSPARVDCKFGSETADEGDSERQQRRMQEKICTGGEKIHHGRITSSTTKNQGVDLHRQRIQERFYIDRRRKGGSEHQQWRIQEKICIGGESRQDKLIDEKGSKRGSSSAEDPGELPHRQTEEGRFGTSTSEDPGEDLHWRRATAGSPRRRERINGWIFIGTRSRRCSTSSEKRRRDLLRLQNQMVEFLVISNSTRCNLALFPSGVGSV